MAIVKGKQRLCLTTPLSGFVIESVNGTPFYNRRVDFESLLAKLVTNARYRGLFAMPYFDAQLHGLEWFVPVMSEEPVRLNMLQGTEQYSAVRAELEEAIRYFERLKSGCSPAESVYLNCLLKYVTPEVLDDITFLIEGKPVIGVWGLKPAGGRTPRDAVVSDVEDRRLHRISFEVEGPGTLKGLSSYIRKHGFRLMPDRDVPTPVPDERAKFVGWEPCDPSGMVIEKDWNFVARFAQIEIPAIPVMPDAPVEGEEITPGIPLEEEQPTYYWVEFEDGQHGTLSDVPLKFQVPAGAIIQPTQVPLVTPHEGYTFAGWSQPLAEPIFADTTFVAQYDVVTLPWWKRWWLWLCGLLGGSGCLAWLLRLLLLLLLLLLFMLLLSRCTSCNPWWGHRVGGGHVDLGGGPGQPVEQITVPGGGVIDDNGNRSQVVDVTVDSLGNPVDNWAEAPVTPPIVGGNGEPVAPVVPADPQNPYSAPVLENRLNIFFEGDNPDLQKWVNDFHKAYPSKDFKVVGADKNTNWIQIEVPEDQRAKVAKELPSKISSQKFIVVDETVMRGNAAHYTLMTSQVVQYPGWHIGAARIPQAWQITQGSGKVTVAVIDDGIDLNHELFDSRITGAYNIFRCDDHLSAGVGHGTHVAGLAVGNAARFNYGVTGVAPKCKLMPVQVFDNGYTTISCLIRGIMYAVNNQADVINVSIGTAYPVELGQMTPEEVQQKVSTDLFKNEEKVWNWVFQQASKKNSIIVFAAGNSDLLATVEPQLRSQSTINVAAINHDFSVTPWSNYGSGTTVSAPGEGIISSVPPCAYDFQDGTSMAAPIVSGIVALMKSVNKNVTVAQAKEALMTSGRNASGGQQAGPIVQADKALRMIK